jgi:hypothetical protein
MPLFTDLYKLPSNLSYPIEITKNSVLCINQALVLTTSRLFYSFHTAAGYDSAEIYFRSNKRHFGHKKYIPKFFRLEMTNKVIVCSPDLFENKSTFIQKIVIEVAPYTAWLNTGSLHCS